MRAFLDENYGRRRPVFGGVKLHAAEPPVRKEKAAVLAPLLRGFCSSHTRMVGHFTDDARVLEFIDSQDLDRLRRWVRAARITFCGQRSVRSCVNLGAAEDLSDVNAVKARLQPQFEEYRKMYTEYYERCKHPNSPALRDPNPVVILYPGIGMFTFAKDKQTARVASEFYINAINVMKGAEAVSEYTSLPRQEAFDIEYWLLEEAKLQRMPKPKALTGKITLITGERRWYRQGNSEEVPGRRSLCGY